MEKKIAIVTDTNSGLSTEQANAHGVYLIPMPVIIDHNTFFENVSISQKEFFERLEQGARVSTSQPGLGELIKSWEKILEEYEELIYLPMSSGLSGGCETAIMLAKEYDERVHGAFEAKRAGYGCRRSHRNCSQCETCFTNSRR